MTTSTPNIDKKFTHLIETRFYLRNDDQEAIYDLVDLIFLNLPSNMVIECISYNKDKIKIGFNVITLTEDLSRKQGKNKN